MSGNWLYLFVAPVMLIQLVQPGGTSATQITVLSSNGIKAVLQELAPQFEQATGRRVAITYSVAAELKRRIESGEAFDLAILTPAAIDELVEQGKITRQSRTVLARSQIALAIRAGTRRPDIRTIEVLKRTLMESGSIAVAKEGAGGVFLAELLRRLQLTEQVTAKLKFTTTGDQVSQAVARAEAELGVLPVSEILSVPGVELLGTFPAEAQGYVVMVAGISTSTAQNDAILDLVRFLTAPAALSVLKQKGMEPG